jgi:ABC-type polysaccharide/polyol phosphate export permease
MLAVYALVFQLLLPNRSPSTTPYALFLFCGLLPWNWLSSSITDGASSLLTHGALLRKILFPAEVLPAVAVFAQGVHFLLALPVLLAALLAGAFGAFGARVPLGWSLLQVPFLMLLQAVLLLGIGLFLAALTVHFRDVKDLLQTVLSVLFFATPVLYTLKDLPKGRATGLLALNPLAPLFSGWHDALFYGRFSPPGTWAAAAGVSIVAFAIGWVCFDRLRDSFPEAV